MNEFDKWAKSEEQRELPQVQEIKRSLADLGATAEHEQPLSVFAEKLNNPVTDKNRKIYVEVPAPKVLIPLLKKSGTKNAWCVRMGARCTEAGGTAHRTCQNFL